MQGCRDPAAQLDAVVSPGVADALDDRLQRLRFRVVGLALRVMGLACITSVRFHQINAGPLGAEKASYNNHCFLAGSIDKKRC